MLIDPRIARMAKVLVEYSLGVQPGWMVTINAPIAALPLVEAAYSHVLRVGGHPFVLLDTPELRIEQLRHGTEGQLSYSDPYKRLMLERSDAVLTIMADTNTRAGNNIESARQALLQRADAPLRSIRMQRIMENRPGSLTLFPTPAYAQDAEMSLSEFEEFVFHACLLDGEEDPADRWRQVSKEQQRIIEWLDGKKEVHVEGPGTDLRMSIEGRTFVNSDGKRNFPSGEVFTSPVESTVQGQIYFNYPSSYGGHNVQGVHLEFEAGRVVKHSAEVGEDFLGMMLNLDAGARMLGEFAIGTNAGVTRITRNTLFDEKIAGTIHCALGEAYPNAGGTNKSAIHWDIVTDMRQGRITVDGETLYENGQFVI